MPTLEPNAGECCGLAERCRGAAYLAASRRLRLLGERDGDERDGCD